VKNHVTLLDQLLRYKLSPRPPKLPQKIQISQEQQLTIFHLNISKQKTINQHHVFPRKYSHKIIQPSKFELSAQKQKLYKQPPSNSSYNSYLFLRKPFVTQPYKNLFFHNVKEKKKII